VYRSAAVATAAFISLLATAATGAPASQAPDDGNIYIMRPDGTGLRPITRSPHADTIPRWSPNSRQLAFLRTPASGAPFSGDVWVATLASGRARAVAATNALEWFPSWSPDSRQLVYVSSVDGARDELRVVRADGTGSRVVAQAPGPRPRRGLLNPSWAPDGRTILFQTSDTSGRADIRTVGVDGGTVTTLGGGIFPRWSPTGSAILFERGQVLFTMRPDGTNVRRIASADRFSLAEWSPNGRTIAFTYRGAIHVVAGRGGRVRRLAPGRWPSWSPDSTRVLYRGRGEILHVADVSTRRVRRLKPLGQSAAWSPNGRWIAFDVDPARLRR
jgi:Tol biopolymer transport system component